MNLGPGVLVGSTALTFAVLSGCSSSDPSPSGAPSEGMTSPSAPPLPPAPDLDAGHVEPGPQATRCSGGEEAVDLQAHACFHVEHGPFAEVVAAAPGSEAPSVSKSHTMYTVALPSGEARWVAFAPKSAGLHAFYSSPPARLALRAATGALTVACEGETEPDVCPALPYQAQAHVEAGETTLVALFPAEGATSVRLVIESLE